MIKIKQGFTLIELLVVIAIIAVLASIALLSLAPAQKAGRDAKRIAELRQVQSVLQLYYNQYSHYPGDSNGACTTNTTNTDTWDELIAALGPLAGQFPPVSAGYDYGTDSTCSSYTLGAQLETNGAVLNDSPDANSYGVTCSRSNKNYCVIF